MTRRWTGPAWPKQRAGQHEEQRKDPHTNHQAQRATSAGGWATIRHLALLLLALPALAQAASVDLVANNTGPQTASAGVPFTDVVKMSNNGPDAADNTSFVATMPVNATGVAAVCTNAINAAACPGAANLVVSNTQVSGTLPQLPNNGLVEVTVTGFYGVPSPTSVSSKLTLTPPSGVSELNPVTNDKTANTTLVVDAKLVVGKTVSVVGNVLTWTVTLKNEGSAAADGAMFEDYLQTSAGTAPQQANVNAQLVSCVAADGAQCPANSEFKTFNGQLNQPSPRLFNTAVPKLPAGGSLTIKYTATVTASTACGLTAGDIGNVARITTPNGITNISGTPMAFVNHRVAGTAACPPSTWNFAINKSQSWDDGTPVANGSAYTYGRPLRYTITVQNNSAAAADGAELRDWVSGLFQAAANAKLQGKLISCTPSAGAVCPAASAFPVINRGDNGFTTASGDLFKVTIPTFPVGGKLTLVYEVVLNASQYCGFTAERFDNSVSVQPPNGPVSPFGPVNVMVPPSAACPDIQVTKTQSTNLPQAGEPIEYEVVVRNNGPDAADGALWDDYLQASGSATVLKAKIDYISCTGTGGAVCPARTQFADHASATLSSRPYLVKSGTRIPTLPKDGVITLRYRVTYEEMVAAKCSAPIGYITNYTGVTPPTGKSAKGASASMQFTCADVGISKNVNPPILTAGQPMTYTVVVSNAGLGAVSGVVFEDPLPAIFKFASASCALQKESVPALPHPRTECGASVDYDAATHTLRSTIKSLGQQGELKFTITGTAGITPGTYKNIATASMPAGTFDPIMGTNYTDANVQIQNTQSPITVRKQVDGLPATGLPVAMTYTGQVLCGTQPPQPWSVTVPAGATSASSAPLTFYDTEVCTVSEDPAPAPPAGYQWVGAPVIGNSASPLGPATPLTVPVTNTLKRDTTSLSLSKRFAGPADALAKVNGNFSFAIDCGVDGSFNTQVSVSAGATASATLTGLPVGASCIVSESASAAAPSGHSWDAPIVDSNPVLIPAVGSTASVQVTNTLKADDPGTVTPVPGLGSAALAALAALLAALGAGWRPRAGRAA